MALAERAAVSALASRLADSRSLASAAALAALVAAPCLLIAATLSGGPVTTTTNFLVLLVAVLALSVYTGGSGILSFGHAAFMLLAAQISATLTMAPALKRSALPLVPTFLHEAQLGLVGALLIAVAMVALLAWLVGLPICRLAGSSAAIATLGLLIIANSVVIGSQGFTRGSQAMYGVPRLVDVPVALAFAVLAIVVARAYRDSMAGLKLRAVRENEPAALAVGIDPARERLLAWVLSGVLAALSGVLMAHFLTVFSPKEFYFDLTFAVIAMLVIGGMTSVSGAVLGAGLVTVMIEILRRLENGFDLGPIAVPQFFGLTQVGLSLVILLTLYKRREGLLGHAELLPLRPRRPVASTRGPQRAPAAALQVSDVSKAYGGVLAVDRVSFTLKTGEILGLIGPNGSGKTTLLGCIAGTHRATGGAVLLDGAEITALAPQQVARRGIGRTFQTIRLFANLTCLENVVAALAERHRAWSRAALEAEGQRLLEELKIGDLWSMPAGTLAYGQQRRLEIARALAIEPNFMLLDEPAAGMNEAESDDLLQILAWLVEQRGLGLVIVDHDLKLIMRLCPRILVLNKGQLIAEGAPSEIQRDAAVREAYLGRRHAAEPAPEPAIKRVSSIATGRN